MPSDYRDEEGREKGRDEERNVKEKKGLPPFIVESETLSRVRPSFVSDRQNGGSRTGVRSTFIVFADHKIRHNKNTHK